ncbi:MAG: sulfotransferase domain-containing protein [Pseudomonadota bacterium]
MRYPNLLLVGVQKAGTTWMHRTLSRSRHVFGSTPKELNLWGQPDYLDRLDAYRAHFDPAQKPSARYFLESTPHYFHAPNIFADVSDQIRSTIADVRVMVILRNPVERYRSAYVHHIRKGRLPFVAEIDRVTDEQIMLATGLYGKILPHWRRRFPDMLVYPFERLAQDPAGLVAEVFGALDVPCDLDPATLSPPLHTSRQKRTEAGWPSMPVLKTETRAALIDYYREDIESLAGQVDFDVRSWLQMPDARGAP